MTTEEHNKVSQERHPQYITYLCLRAPTMDRTRLRLLDDSSCVVVRDIQQCQRVAIQNEWNIGQWLLIESSWQSIACAAAWMRLHVSTYMEMWRPELLGWLRTTEVISWWLVAICVWKDGGFCEKRRMNCEGVKMAKQTRVSFFFGGGGGDKTEGGGETLNKTWINRKRKHAPPPTLDVLYFHSNDLYYILLRIPVGGLEHARSLGVLDLFICIARVSASSFNRQTKTLC